MKLETLSRSCVVRAVPVLHVARHGDHHTLHDLTVDIALELDPAAAETPSGAGVVRAVHALAAEHAGGEPELYARAIARYCMQRLPAVRHARVEARARSWDRLTVGDRPRGRDRVGPAAEVRVAHAELRPGVESTGAGIRDLLLLTSQPPGGAMLLRLAATWSYGWADVPYATQWQQVRRVLLDACAERADPGGAALADALARAVLEQAPPVSEVEISLEAAPYEPLDMTSFGMENTGSVFGGTAAARTVHGTRVRRSEIL